MKSWLVWIVPFLLWMCCTSQNVCKEPLDIDFGEVVSGEKAEYLESDRVQYKCNPGYAMEGSEWITCNGRNWIPQPKCLAPCSISREELDAKKLLLSGGRRGAQLIQNDQTVQFLCREGYVLTTPSVRKCIDGHMDLPFCITERGKNCSRPPTIQNGDVTTSYQKQYTSGSSVEFKCQRDYTMKGHERSFCDNGNWTKVPNCLEPCAISLSEMESKKIEPKGRLDEIGFQNMYVQHGNSVELTCKPGYTLATNPSQSAFAIRCNERPVVFPECKEIVCLPPQVDNGNFLPKRNQYEYKETIQIQCEAGYHSHEHTSNCTENGWSPHPSCIQGCSSPHIENGREFGFYHWWRKHLPRRVGETVDFQCNPGFLPANKDKRLMTTCTDFGWDPEPKCFKKCDQRIRIPHGRIMFRYWFRRDFIEGEELSFSCDEGYTPEQQPAKTRCTKDGWSPTPVCTTVAEIG